MTRRIGSQIQFKSQSQKGQQNQIKCNVSSLRSSMLFVYLMILHLKFTYINLIHYLFFCSKFGVVFACVIVFWLFIAIPNIKNQTKRYRK